MKYLIKTKYARFVFYYDFDNDAFALYKDYKLYANLVDLNGYVTKNGHLLTKAFMNDYRFFFPGCCTQSEFRDVLNYFVTKQKELNKSDVLYTVGG